jgi:hypothetical protein
MCQDGRDSVPTDLSVAPCSGPSRRGLATPRRKAEKRATAGLAGPSARRLGRQQAGTKERPQGTNKGTARDEELPMI